MTVMDRLARRRGVLTLRTFACLMTIVVFQFYWPHFQLPTTSGQEIKTTDDGLGGIRNNSTHVADSNNSHHRIPQPPSQQLPKQHQPLVDPLDRITSSSPPYLSNTSALKRIHFFKIDSFPLHHQQLGCLRHTPLNVSGGKGFFFGVGVNNNTNVTFWEMRLRHGAGYCAPLRRDWQNNPPLSLLAQLILQHQSNCSLPVIQWSMQKIFVGIGSSMAYWSHAMCFALEHQVQLQTFHPNWTWLDQTLCDAQQAQQPPWLCYFPAMERLCSQNDDGYDNNSNGFNLTVIKRQHCQQKDQVEGFVATLRTAAVEYIFQRVSPLVIQEAQRQVGVVFGPMGAPRDIITVHVRWGDKGREMQLVAMEAYIQGVWKMLEARAMITERKRTSTTADGPSNENHRHNNATNNNNNTNLTNIYLATEDPEAAQAFIKAAPTDWNIYVDVAIQELTPFRLPSSVMHGSAVLAKNTRGRVGLVHMGSLLVSMPMIMSYRQVVPLEEC